MTGPERKSRDISKKENEIVAVHESGHALLTLLLMDNAEHLHKVSIIPSGMQALGYTLHLPLEDRYVISEKELYDKITILLGGCAAEEIVFGSVTTGANNDFEAATGYAQRMVRRFGMSRRLGQQFSKKDRQIFLGRDLLQEKDHSESTTGKINAEVRYIVNECHKTAYDLLKKHKDQLRKIYIRLLEKKVLDAAEIKSLIGHESSR